MGISCCTIFRILLDNIQGAAYVLERLQEAIAVLIFEIFIILGIYNKFFEKSILSSAEHLISIWHSCITLVANTLLCESALLVTGKSFVTLYTDFSFKQLKKNAVAAKGKSFGSLVSKGFFLKK